MYHRHTHPKADPLILQFSLLTLGALLTFTSSAGDSFLSKPNLADLEDGDVVLAGAEHNGTAVHMSLMSPSLADTADPAGTAAAFSTDSMPDVYLSLRVSW